MNFKSRKIISRAGGTFAAERSRRMLRNRFSSLLLFQLHPRLAFLACYRSAEHSARNNLDLTLHLIFIFMFAFVHSSQSHFAQLHARLPDHH